MTMQALYWLVALVHSVTDQQSEGFTVLTDEEGDWGFLRLRGYVETEFRAPDRMGKTVPTQKGRDFVNDLLRIANK